MWKASALAAQICQAREEPFELGTGEKTWGQLRMRLLAPCCSGAAVGRAGGGCCHSQWVLLPSRLSPWGLGVTTGGGSPAGMLHPHHQSFDADVCRHPNGFQCKHSRQHTREPRQEAQGVKRTRWEAEPSHMHLFFPADDLFKEGRATAACHQARALLCCPQSSCFQNFHNRPHDQS